MTTKIRLAREDDVAFLYDIQKNSYKQYWTTAQWRKQIGNTQLVVLVLEVEFIVVGYVILKVSKHKTVIVSIAINPKHRKKGYGRLLMNEVKRDEQNYIEASVDEYNLGGQLFFKAEGFIAELPIEFNKFSKINEYLMVFDNGRGK